MVFPLVFWRLVRTPFLLMDRAYGRTSLMPCVNVRITWRSLEIPMVVMGTIVTSLPSTVTVGAVAEEAVIQAEYPMADVLVVDEEGLAGAGQRRSGIKTWLTSAMILPSRRTQVICIISLT